MTCIRMQVQANNLRHCQKYNELDISCATELMLISKKILIYIAAPYKGANYGLKGQFVLVPVELKTFKLQECCF